VREKEREKVCVYEFVCVRERVAHMCATQWCTHVCHYEVALVSRIDKIIGLFCKRAL